ESRRLDAIACWHDHGRQRLHIESFAKDVLDRPIAIAAKEGRPLACCFGALNGKLNRPGNFGELFTYVRSPRPRLVVFGSSPSRRLLEPCSPRAREDGDC